MPCCEPAESGEQGSARVTVLPRAVRKTLFVILVNVWHGNT
jgi:hypothetical protein